MKNTWKRNYKKNRGRLVLDIVVLACVILLGLSLYLWWTKIFMNPERVLDDAIASSLKTRSVTKTVQQTGLTGGINQVTYLSFYPSGPRSQTNSVLTQGVGSNASSVATQTIGTPESDFVRYTNVQAGGQGQSQGVERFQSIIGKWAQREQNLSKGSQVSFLNESLFGILPLGYLNDQQSDELIGVIEQKNVYKYTSVKRVIENKRPVFVYDMSINPADLVTVLQEYIKLTGAGDPNQFSPDQYRGLGDVKIQMTIDALSRQVTEVKYSTGRVEKYDGQNLYHQIELPAQTIPVEELQKRLQGISTQS